MGNEEAVVQEAKERFGRVRESLLSKFFVVFDVWIRLSCVSQARVCFA